MKKKIIYPPGAWALFARGWERALRSENKSHNTIWAYLQAVRLLGEWSHRQSPIVQPTEITHRHIQQFLAELIDRTSAGNAHTNYRGLRTFWKWMVLEDEVELSPMDKTKPPRSRRNRSPSSPTTTSKPCWSSAKAATTSPAATPRSSASCSTPAPASPKSPTSPSMTSTWTSTSSTSWARA